MNKQRGNRLVVGDASWAADIPEWLLAEIAAERMVAEMASLLDGAPPRKPEVGDAEICAYLMTASLRAPMPSDIVEVYVWITARICKRQGKKLDEFMEAKLRQGLTYSEDYELTELRRKIYQARGGPVSHPVIDAMRQLKKDVRDMPPISSIPDPEYASRIDAERVTLEFKQASTRPLDAGKQPMADSPLFGGERQERLFE